jgi:lycopene beta-cyclase
VGFQKFIGLELQLEANTAPLCPVLMDATVPQTDGFRFFYTLPFAPDRILVEDTYFADTPVMNRTAIVAGILDYAAGQGHQVRSIVREESGVLPLPLEGATVPPTAGPLVAGYRGGFFHPVTGYSFPAAARLAEFVADTAPRELFGPGLERLYEALTVQVRFGQRLNRMLFNWFAPEDRYNVLERFYRLPERTIRKFYAMDLGMTDRVRVLFGLPPRGMSWRAALSGGVAGGQEASR